MNSLLHLIPSSPEYASLWHKWRSGPSSVKYNPIQESSLESLKSRMAKMSSDLKSLEDKEYQWFVQFTRSQGFKDELVGTVSMKNVSLSMGYAEIGYGIGEEFQGRGFGFQAVRMAVELIFAETALRKLIAYVAKDNVASCRILQKLGFEQEGILREHYMIQGVPVDEVIFGFRRGLLTGPTRPQLKEPEDSYKKNLSDVLIRRLETSDFEEFKVLVDEVDSLHRKNLPKYFKKPEPPARTPEQFSGWLKDPNISLLAAELDGKLVGISHSLFKSIEDSPLHAPRKYGVLDMLVTDPSYRGLGIGKRLTEASQQWAKEKGATEMELGVWAFNREAIHFYEKLGYWLFYQKMTTHL